MSGMQTALWHITIFVVTKFRCQSAEPVHVTDWFIRSRKAAGLGEASVYHLFTNTAETWWTGNGVNTQYSAELIVRYTMSLTCKHFCCCKEYTVLYLQMTTFSLQTQIWIFERILLIILTKINRNIVFI